MGSSCGCYLVLQMSVSPDVLVGQPMMAYLMYKYSIASVVVVAVRI